MIVVVIVVVSVSGLLLPLFKDLYCAIICVFFLGSFIDFIIILIFSVKLRVYGIIV